MSQSTPRVDETPLEETVKIRFPDSLDARIKLVSRQLEPIQSAARNGDDYAEFLCQVEGPLTRQKTNLVIETVGEAEAMLKTFEEFKDGSGKYGRNWCTGMHAEAYKRGRRELTAALEAQGYAVNDCRVEDS